MKVLTWTIGMWLAFLIAPQAALAETAFFVVSEMDSQALSGDSYVLVLEDDADIAHARNLVVNGPSVGRALVVAKIAPGPDGVNRNVLAAGKPNWSWHLVSFESFADSTIEILDGSPTMVEEDIDWWMQNTGGFIGFWGYTVTAELEEPLLFPLNAGLNDAWFNPETDGQGFFITVFPDLQLVSLAWFTYDTELPAGDASAQLGDPGHRWLTALGTIEGDASVMNITFTAGGLFDMPTDIERSDGGVLTLSFKNCNSGTVAYDIPSINRQGIVPIKRVANDNISLCEALLGE